MKYYNCTLNLLKKLHKKGKEWLKLLGLRTWCPREDGKFILPKDYILSNNIYFNQAINALEDIPVLLGIDAMNYEEEEKKEEKKEENKEENTERLLQL